MTCCRHGPNGGCCGEDWCVPPKKEEAVMPRQVYKCLKCGEFERIVSTKAEVPKSWPCPLCQRKSRWLPSAGNLIGGPTTGARKE